MESKAKREILASRPYFDLLSSKDLNKTLRVKLISKAPAAFYSVLTQCTRHLLNGSFCNVNKQFCKRFETSLYILALPGTKLADKRKILINEPPELVRVLYNLLNKSLGVKEDGS